MNTPSRYNEVGQDTWMVADEDLVKAQILDPDPEPCPVCHREASAVENCHACGDAIWVRPDVNEALGRVFDGDTGLRRRDQDKAA